MERIWILFGSSAILVFILLGFLIRIGLAELWDMQEEVLPFYLRSSSTLTQTRSTRWLTGEYGENNSLAGV